MTDIESNETGAAAAPSLRRDRQAAKEPRRAGRGERKAKRGKKDDGQVQPLRPAPRGWGGAGGGSATLVPNPPHWRGSTKQVCGLWPFAAATGAPTVGVPLGVTKQGTAACGDPISWFTRAKLISNPSAFILAKPGLGKSTLTRRWQVGLHAYGVLPLVLGDLRPDHVKTIRALGGQVIQLGYDRDAINVLDPGEARAALKRLTGEHRSAVLADMTMRRRTMIEALLTIARRTPPPDTEMNIVDEILRILDERFVDEPPVLSDMLDVLREAPASLREVAVDRGDIDRYHERVDHLERSLVGLVNPHGRFGGLFGRRTTTPMHRDRPVVFDVSSLADKDPAVEAAILLACWSTGFATVNVANELAAAGLEPQRHYFVVLDELWKVIRSGQGMVDRIDSMTRLNRTMGVGQVMISHTLGDLESLASAEDIAKAKGFIERAGMVVCGGLPAAEMPGLTEIIPLSQAEQNELIRWTDPPAWDHERGREGEPPGRGWFLIKVGGRPGIPVHVELTPQEAEINETNAMWVTQSRVGGRVDAPTSEAS